MTKWTAVLVGLWILFCSAGVSWAEGQVRSEGSADDAPFTPDKTWVTTAPGRLATSCAPEASADSCDAVGSSLTVVLMAPTENPNTLAVLHLLVGAPPETKIGPGKYRFADMAEFDPNPAQPIAFARFSRSINGEQTVSMGVSGQVIFTRVSDTEVEGRFEAVFAGERRITASFIAPIRHAKKKPTYRNPSPLLPLRTSPPAKAPGR